MSRNRRSTTGRIWTGVVAVGLVVGVVAAPSATALPTPGDPEAPVSQGIERSDDSAGLVAGTPSAARGLTTSGQVTVMLELTTPPASVAYTRALALGAAAAERAEASQVANVTRLAVAVESQLTRPATRATVLYRAARVYAGIAVTTDSARLPALASIAGVKAVHRMTPKSVGNWTSVPLIRAPEAWSEGGTGRPNGTGNGVDVGIIDTGIDYTHANFGGVGSAAVYSAVHAASDQPAPLYFPSVKVAGGYDFAGDGYDGDGTNGSPTPAPDANPLDCNGHGSHVAGSAAGYGITAGGATYSGPWSPSTDFGSMKVGPGVAPQATLYALKVFGCQGTTYLLTAALDWAAAHGLDVVNMSIGSSYGAPDDPDSVASDNAVDMGISVVASIGNNGDLYETGGSPGSATKVLATAATVDNAEVADGIAVTDPSGPTTTQYPATRSVALDWTGVAVTAPVSRIGTWGQPPSPSNNTDGCSAIPAGSLTGTIVLLWWDDATSRRCGSSARSLNARNAGASGAVLESGLSLTTGITGDTVIPVMLTTAPGSAALDAIVTAGRTPTVTLTNALRNSQRISITGPDDPTDTAASYTSRGLARGVKPDVGAPGDTIFSTAVGTGNEGVTLSGTSMASPQVAGVAAILRQAHPAWTPEQVKAAIINTAGHDVYAGPARTGARYDAMRVGSGRVDAGAAVVTDAVVYTVDDPGAVSVSFGVVSPTAPSTLVRTVRVADKRTSGPSRSYALSVDMLNTLDGAAYSVAPTSVSLAPGASTDVQVSLQITDTAALVHKADPTIELQSGRDYLTPLSGRLLVTPQGAPTLRLPLFAAPRPSGTVTGGTGVVVGGSDPLKTGTITLTGGSVDTLSGVPGETLTSRVSALALGGRSGPLPPCGGPVVTNCIPYDDVRAADLRYVGFSSAARSSVDPFGATSVARAYVGVAAWGTWRTAADISEFDVLLDLNRDGVAEAVLYNGRSAGTDVFGSWLADVRGPKPVVVEGLPLNSVFGDTDTAKLATDVMVLPVRLKTLASRFGVSAAAPTIDYWVRSYSVGTGGLVDTIGSAASPLTANLAEPALTAFGADGPLPNDGRAGQALTVTLDPAQAGATPTLLLLHHLNVSDLRAELVPVWQHPTVSAVSPPTGRTTGGTLVTVTGTHLTGATSVSFGGVAGTSVAVVDDDHVTVRTPAHPAGGVDLYVTTPGGTTVSPGAFTYVTAAPGAPTNVGASAGNASATVWWTAPADPGTSPVVSYTVTGAPAGTCTVSAPATSCPVAGLANGQPYTFTVTATSAHGTGPASGPSPAVVPTTGAVLVPPGQPGPPLATAGVGAATVRVAPPNAGGPPATYVVTASPGGRTCTVTVPATRCTVSRLTAGRWYRFTAVAVNAAGTSAVSPPSNRVMPMRRQLPVRRLGLPTAVRNAGWTRLIHLPVVMNSGRSASLAVTVTPRRGSRVGSTAAAHRVVRDRQGWVWLWLRGTVASTVKVTVRAPALPGYTSYLAVTTYLTRAVA